MPLTATETSASGLPVFIPPAGVSRLRRWAPALCLALLSVLYLVPTCVRAAREKLWFDEIYALDASTLLPSLGALWAYLRQGIEGTPPLGFILAAASESVLGRNEFGLRFPSIVAFWIMALCLYVFLRRRLPWPFAIAGLLLPMLTAAGRYSYEARPYALVLALAGIALVAWQAAAEGRRRRVALVAIAVALAAALCSHPMAVTLALPFLAGEIARTMQRKRVDWPMWCAFASAAPALLVLWGLKDGRDFTAIYCFRGSVLGHIVTTYSQILTPAIAPLGLAFLLLLVLRRQDTGTVTRTRGMPAYELAALVGFALIPFAAVPISTLSGNYYLRYSLNCTIGLAGLLVVLLVSVGGTSRLAGVIGVAVLGVSFTIGQFLPENRRPGAGLKFVNSSEEIQPFLEQMPSDAPIVICSDLTFVELEHYSSPRLAARLYYLTDPAAAAAIDGDIAFEVKGSLLARFFPFRAHFEDYHSFIAAHRRFYVVRPMRNIVREYQAGQISLEPRETAGHFQYYEAGTR